MPTDNDLKTSIVELLNDLDALLVAHFYQKDEVVELAHHTGDSLELAKIASQSDKKPHRVLRGAFHGRERESPSL